MYLSRRWFFASLSAVVFSLYLAGAAPFRAEVHALSLEANGPPAGSPEAAKGDPDDPFDPSNRVQDEPGSTPATQKVAAAPVKKLDASPIDDRIEFKISLEPEQARRGETVKMTIAGQLKPGYHTYPMTKRSAAQGPDGQSAQDALGLSRLAYEESPGLKPLWPVKESEPMFENEEGSGWMLEHKSDFTWTQDILILPDAQPGVKHLRFKIVLQVCDKTCILGQPSFDAPITVTDASPVALTPALQERLKVKQQAIEDVVPASDGLPGNLNPSVVGTLPGKNKPDGKPETEANSSAPPVRNPEAKLEAPAPKGPPAGDLLAFILQGIVFGGISLVTPCVFPMIPITVSFFLKQSEKEHHKPLGMALVYSGTIVAVLTIGGVLLSAVLQKASLHWATNFVLGALFIYFALSLFGMYEIRLPTGLLNLTSAQEGRGGLLGTVFMALTFTIISFTCVAPFYGGFIGLQATAASASDWLRLGIGALAFSLTFASPFFFLALVPGLLRSLPKSGSWMNTIKVVMAFLEIAAALKFLRSGELAVFGQASILTYDLVLGCYVALAFLCGLYLLGVYRLPHDHEPVEHIGVLRMLFSLFFLTLGLYMMPGLFRNGSAERQRPAGKVFAWLDSFLLQDPPADQYGSTAVIAGSEAAKDASQRRLVWLNDVHVGLKEALEQKRLVFIDFTGLI